MCHWLLTATCMCTIRDWLSVSREESWPRKKVKSLFPFTPQDTYCSLLEWRRGCEDVLVTCWSPGKLRQEGNSERWLWCTSPGSDLVHVLWLEMPKKSGHRTSSFLELYGCGLELCKHVQSSGVNGPDTNKPINPLKQRAKVSSPLTFHNTFCLNSNDGNIISCISVRSQVYRLKHVSDHRKKASLQSVFEDGRGRWKRGFIWESEPRHSPVLSAGRHSKKLAKVAVLSVA